MLIYNCKNFYVLFMLKHYVLCMLKQCKFTENKCEMTKSEKSNQKLERNL